MTCHQAAFMRATCRIDIDERGPSDDPLRYTAVMSVVDEHGPAEVHPIVAEDGRRLEIHATSESLAFNSAITYLERQFGGFSASIRQCDVLVPAPTGAPFVVQV